jgi:acyl-CoA thioesterase II
MWIRVPGPIGDDPNRHQTLIAFMSDFALLGAALLPHPYTAMSKKIQAASLDHAIWFHRAGTCRRLSSLLDGQHQCRRRSRLQSRSVLQPRRASHRLDGTGVPDQAAV